MKVILTGDIVASRNKDTATWNIALKDILSTHAESFDIFRGDSFQAIVDVQKAFATIFYLIAKLKAMGIRVRIGIGIGAIDHQMKSVKESTGEAYIHSGEAFDGLNKELLKVKSPWPLLDEQVNIMLGLCGEMVHRWTTNMAETVAIAIQYPNKNQKELAKILRRTHQSQISTELNKAGFSKIKSVIDYSTKIYLEKC